MISEERLNDIINKKGTVWVVYSITPEKNGVVEMTAKRYEHLIKPAIILQAAYGLKNLFETKEDAEFVFKTRAERTEYFEPPTWEDFLKTEEYKFISYNGFREKIYIEPTTGKLSSCTRFIGKPTKENYIKACEMARKLFLGEYTE